jgi:acetyl esterase/lipase
LSAGTAIGGDPQRPAIALIHGGCWRRRYGRSLMRDLERDCRARGFAVHNLEYRRLGRFGGGGWPHTFDDVADAVAAIDGPVATVGHSAGGHLAVWAASLPNVVATVSQAGILDLREASRLGVCGGQVDRLMRGRADLYTQASPIERLPLSRPALLVQGLDDQIVPPELARGYHAAATAAGDTCELVELAGVGHFEHIDPATQAWRIVAEWLEGLSI